MSQAQQPGEFRKSRHSSGDNDCVEVADDRQRAWIRDSKAPLSGTLKLGRTAFDAFQSAIRAL